jgi:oligopeptide/dipeptide ABC transporter ATP-binding protein
MSEPGELLRVEGLKMHFPVTRGLFGRVVGQVRAVDDVSFTIAPGETLGLVGESGSGKTTVGRAILRLLEPTAGRVRFDGRDMAEATPRELRELRRSLQVIFQDPYSSLNPRFRVIDIVGEPLEVHGLAHGAQVEKRVAELLRRVGLSPAWMNRYPHEFSGGQRQRIGIARAIALGPKLVVCDEPVSALDVSIQAQVVNLLKELRRELGLAYLFIAHDLSVVRHLSQRVAVMYLGELVEIAPVSRLFATPAHPYTRALLAAIPVPDPRHVRRRLTLSGDIPSPLNPPSGCRFHTRCPAVMERCRSEPPARVTVEPGHAVTCIHAYDAEGDDWYRVVNERIERAIAANARTAPEPLHVTPLAAAPRAVTTAPVAAALPTSQKRARSALAPLTATPRRRALTFALALGALALIVTTWRSSARTNTAERQLQLLTAELTARARVIGRHAESLAELGWRLPPIFGNKDAIDPWGRPFVYRPPTSPGASFELRSLGPDGVPSADDLPRKH